MGGPSNKVIQIVSQYSAKIRDSHIFFAPGIPEQKLRTALGTYAPIQEGEHPLVLIDDTMRGGAKEGALLTDRRLYARNLRQKPRWLDFSEIESVKFTTGKLFRSWKICVNGAEFLVTTVPERATMEQFSEMLRDIAATLKTRTLPRLSVERGREPAFNRSEETEGTQKATPEQPAIPTPTKGQPKPGGWRTVRIFISSTFRDMHAERDYLVKVVFPELRERCARGQLHLVDIDLRWGVTEAEAEQGKVLDIILDEIDRSRPFFVAILGERYGFVPEKVTEDTEFAHPWLREYPGHSLTALEIIHGVLRKPDLANRSFFYFRDPQFISQLPESRRSDFVAESPEAARKLAVVKDKSRASGRPLMENYPCRWDSAEERLVDLDLFGQRVLEDLWQAICAEYPEAAEVADPLVVERQMHEAFAEERSRLHVGRLEQMARLTRYVEGKDRRPMVITGESGCGKSAFLASWYRQYTAEHPDDFVLAYFIGATPDSTNHFRLLRNMCRELKLQCGLKEEIPEDGKKLSEALAVLLSAASQSQSRVVIMLDALDQLSPLEGAYELNWLLDYMPEKTRLVVSSLEGDCHDVLQRREAEEISLPPLTADEQRQIVQILLGEWRRKLDVRQMVALLAHPGVKNPLYLRVALEELRLFGKFEELTERITTLADDIPRLLDQVLERLEEDHGREVVTEAFGLLSCSRHGLSEAELLELMRRQRQEQFPLVRWVRLARGAKAYLVQRGELIGFFHRYVAEAVAARYPERVTKHAILAAYFAQAPLERKLDEYPYQLQQKQDWSGLSTTLSDLDFFEYACTHNKDYEWMGYWRSLKGHFEPGPCYQAAVEAKIKLKGENRDVIPLLQKIGGFLDNMGAYAAALPLEKRVLTIQERVLGRAHPDVAATLISLGQLYLKQGRETKIVPLFDRAQNILQYPVEPYKPKTANHLINRAELHMQKLEFARALPLYQKALAIQEAEFGLDHPALLACLDGLGRLYQEKGKLQVLQYYLDYHKGKRTAQAEEIALALSSYQRALAIRERAFGTNHPDVAKTLTSLADLHVVQGQYDTAVSMYRHALAIMERALGPEHPEMADTMHRLAELYDHQGREVQALRFYQRMFVIRERALGSHHRDVGAALDALAGAYIQRRFVAASKAAAWRAIAVRSRFVLTMLRMDAWFLGFGVAIAGIIGLLVVSKVLNVTWGAILLALLVLCMTISRFFALGFLGLILLSVSLELFVEVDFMMTRLGTLIGRLMLPINERLLGPAHAGISPALAELANGYKELGKYDKALRLYEQAITINERAYGADHADIAFYLDRMARIYHFQGEYADALPLWQRALRISEAASGTDHPDTLSIGESLRACEEAISVSGVNGQVKPAT